MRSVVTVGLRWTWSSSPPRRVIPPPVPVNPSLSPFVKEFVRKGAVVRTRKPIFPSRIFTVPKASGGDRLILDVSSLNRWIQCPSFKMHNHNHVRKIISPGSWVVSIDIQDAYLHIPIHPLFQSFLAFQHGSRWYKFLALPFGLNIAPRVFTAVMRVPICQLRDWGVSIVAYLDDLILWAPTRELCRTHMTLTCNLLRKMGFLLNLEKSCLEPSQCITWVGVHWDLTRDCWSLPQTTVTSTTAMASALIQQGACSRRDMESMVGKAAWAGQILPEARLQAHYLASAIPLFSPDHRLRVLRIPDFLLSHLQWWTNQSNLSAVCPLHADPISASIWTDASDQGWGALSSTGASRQGVWDAPDQRLHINLKETRAIRLAIEQDLVPPGLHVQVFMDNKTAHFAIARRGSSRSPPLQREIHALFRTLSLRDMTLTSRFLEGASNVAADQLSRTEPVPTEWELDPRDFARILAWHGPLLVDGLASPLNSKLPDFICPFPHPLARSADLFSTPLESLEGMYLFPPCNLIPKVLQFLCHYKGSGILVLPDDCSASWAPVVARRYPRALQLSFPPFQWVQGERTLPSSPLLQRLIARSLWPRF